MLFTMLLNHLVQDEISSPISAPIFELYDPELFLETLQNSEVTSSSNCCYEENPSYAPNISPALDVDNKLMNSNSKAVMMAWEKPLMEAHAKAICSGGGHISNIGFGMGLVDTAIQQYAPATHTIFYLQYHVLAAYLHNFS